MIPYSDARLTPADPVVEVPVRRVIRVVEPMTLDAWTKQYCSPEALAADAAHDSDRLTKQLEQLAAEKKAAEERKREEMIRITMPEGKLN